MTLTEAWEKRKTIWMQGNKLIEEGNQLWKEIAQMPATGAIRAAVWYSLSDQCREAADKVHQGYALKCEADGIWLDALTEHKSPKVKLTWAYDGTKKAYGCTLETGEIFEA